MCDKKRKESLNKTWIENAKQSYIDNIKVLENQRKSQRASMLDRFNDVEIKSKRSIINIAMGGNDKVSLRSVK